MRRSSRTTTTTSTHIRIGKSIIGINNFQTLKIELIKFFVGKSMDKKILRMNSGNPFTIILFCFKN